MFEEILFPADGSQGGDEARECVLDLAAGHDATLHVLSVADTSRSAVERAEEVVDALERRADRIVTDAAGRAQQRGVDVVTEVRSGRPHEAILDYAASAGVDLVAMPTHGRQGLERFLLGSTTERVVRRSDAPVLTFQPGLSAFDYPFERVLVPTDGSDAAREALDYGVGVAGHDDAALHLLSVVNASSLGVDVRSDMVASRLEKAATAVVDAASEYATDAGVEPAASTVEYGSSVHRTILDYVDDHDVDLVVVGTHGRTGFDRYVLGSVTEYLVRTSPVPVLTVRAPES